MMGICIYNYIHLIIIGDNGTIGGLTIWFMLEITIVNGRYPLVNLQFANWKHTIFSSVNQRTNWAIFHSYVNLTQGNGI